MNHDLGNTHSAELLLNTQSVNYVTTYIILLGILHVVTGNPSHSVEYNIIVRSDILL